MIALRVATDFIVATSCALVGGMAVVSWLLSYRRPRAVPEGPAARIFALPRSVQIIGGLAALALLAYVGHVFWVPLPLRVSATTWIVLRLSALAPVLGGTVLAMWGRWALGPMWGASTSFAVQLRPGHRLIQHGPYRRVRHPMYLGYWLILAGVAVAYPTWSSAALVLFGAAVFCRRALLEEKVLAARFVAEWKVYVSKTGFLLPRTRPGERAEHEPPLP